MTTATEHKNNVPQSVKDTLYLTTVFTESWELRQLIHSISEGDVFIVSFGDRAAEDRELEYFYIMRNGIRYSAPEDTTPRPATWELLIERLQTVDRDGRLSRELYAKRYNGVYMGIDVYYEGTTARVYTRFQRED